MTRSVSAPARMLAAIVCAGAVGAPGPAQAAWLGLADGTYDITLTCDNSTVLTCPQTLQGTLQVAGNGASQLGVTVGGQVFDGDPFDTTPQFPNVEYEASTLVQPVFAFLSLRLTTAGAFGNYGAGERWWAYCHALPNGNCAPETFGTWTARAVVAVPEPATWALALLGLGLAARARPRG